MDGFIVTVVRFLAQLAAHLGVWSIRLGERLKVKLQHHRPLATSGALKGAIGVPASSHAHLPSVALAQPSMPAPVTPAATQHAVTPPFSAASQPIVIEPKTPPDELDWAGSLNHAAVASLHLGHTLAMVRAGWLVSDEDRLGDVCAVLNAMEAFRDRTVAAVAPLLEAMTDEQRVEFFADFGDCLPPEISDLDTLP